MRTLTVIALAAALSPPAFAQAQSAVTLYGIFDAAVEHLNNVGPSRDRLTRMPTLTGTVPSRLGFRGIEDLGGGLRAIFVLEMGFGPDSGILNQGGRAFGRQAWVGVSGGWGSLTFGRQYTMLFVANGDADVMGPNAYGISSLDNYFPNAREDNSIVYRVGIGGFQFGATYSVGRDGVNAGPSPAGTNCPGESIDREACSGYSAMLKYDAPTWGAALATDAFRGGTAAFAGLTSSTLSDTRTMLNGYLKLGTTKVGAGYLRRRNEGNPVTPRSELAYLGVSTFVTPLIALEGEVFQLKFKNSANKATLGVLRATYSLSKRSTVYTTAGHIDNSGALAISASGAQAGGAPVAGGTQLGIATGIRHTF